MSYDIAPLTHLSEQFEKLPGIGRKSAQRLAFYVLNMSEDEVKEFSEAMLVAKNKIHLCDVCQNITEEDVCSICSSKNRDKTTICVVEDPRDVLAFEKTQNYNGMYHVLHGVISPIDGITPDKLKIKELLQRINDDTKEIIMALNPSLEGDSTSMYISKLLKPLGLKITRLATGIPTGGTLEYTDSATLSKALLGRNEL